MRSFSGCAALGERYNLKLFEISIQSTDAVHTRIMWCWFYAPDTLPRSYVRWIGNLANLDPRLKYALKALREGNFSYERNICNPPDLLTSMSTDLGFPASWGNPIQLPARGSDADNLVVWKDLEVKGRDGLGGLPCEIVHGGVGRSLGLPDNSCTVNVAVRQRNAFLKALLIYLPVRWIVAACARVN